MNVIVDYRKYIQNREYSRVFSDTTAVFCDAEDFLITVCDAEWADISIIGDKKHQCNSVEKLVHRTKDNTPKYGDFDAKFYKLPSYLRRSVISEAVGKVSTYRKALDTWNASDQKTRGKKPGFPKAGHSYPCLFRNGMYIEDGMYFAKIKVFIRNTWDWVKVPLRKSDVDYITKHCWNLKESAPTLMKRGKRWCLEFMYTVPSELKDVSDYKDTVIAAVDMGLNNNAVISVMKSDGTILGREFLKLPKETDRLNHQIGRIKKAQKHGSYKTLRLWAYAKGTNDRISVLTAQFIVDTAVKYNADVIVMEHLDTRGKKRGSKKQRLHHWRCQYIQRMVESKAHRQGIHISRVCAWGTSKLAFDGSGKVSRGEYTTSDGVTHYNYSICTFTTGKQYHCDLNASYNIGARYFVREISKSMPATDWQELSAKVPGGLKRSTCTLSTLISLNAVLVA